MEGDRQGRADLVGTVLGPADRHPWLLERIEQGPAQGLGMASIGGPGQQPALGFPVIGIEQPLRQPAFQGPEPLQIEPAEFKDPSQGQALARQDPSPHAAVEGDTAEVGQVGAEAVIDQMAGREPAVTTGCQAADPPTAQAHARQTGAGEGDHAMAGQGGPEAPVAAPRISGDATGAAQFQELAVQPGGGRQWVPAPDPLIPGQLIAIEVG